MKLNNPFYQQPTSLFFLIGLIASPLMGYADTAMIPAPQQTVASRSISAVEEIGKPVKTVITPPPVIQKNVVELTSKYISKNQAVHYLNTGKYSFAVSYSINANKSVTPTKLPINLFYYLNRHTHKIGIAYNQSAAKAISVSPSDVYSAKDGETLRETIQRWAEKAGYKMQWLSQYDYRLQYSYEFVGRLADEFGPLNQILTSISGNNYVLKAVISKNKVILIKDNDYSPSVLSR